MRMADIKREDWEQRGTEPMTRKQQKMLNAVCGDIAAQLHWRTATGEPIPLDKDTWRHLFAGIILGARFMQGWDHGSGPGGFIILERSSLDMSKSQACDAITMALHFGEHPDEQGIKAARVNWCDAVLRGTGWNPEDLR
jgi:hypothetical protein